MLSLVTLHIKMTVTSVILYTETLYFQGFGATGVQNRPYNSVKHYRATQKSTSDNYRKLPKTTENLTKN